MGDKGIFLHSDHFFHDGEKNNEPQLGTVMECEDLEVGEDGERKRTVIPFPISQKLLVKQVRGEKKEKLFFDEKKKEEEGEEREGREERRSRGS